MKYFFVILALGLVGGGFFYYITENEKAAAAEAYQRELAERAREEERQAQQKIEDERIRKERMANLAKEDAVRLLQKYIAKQEDQLKATVEECQIKIKMIEVDQASLSDELVALEKEEEAKAKDAARRKVKRRDKNERVDALLASPTLNRLARSYVGEDFAKLRGEFKSHMENLIAINEREADQLANNKQKYNQVMLETETEVTQRLDAANESGQKADEMIKAQLKKKREHVALIENRVKKLQKWSGIRALSQWEKRELDQLIHDLAIAQAQLSTDENTAQLSEADRLHRLATHAVDSAARRRDAAVIEKAEADDAVHARTALERDVYNLAVSYENRSLDRVSDAIRRAADQWREKLAVARKKLEFLNSSSGNMDFLNADEVERVRKRIAGKIADDSFWVEE